MKRYTLDFLDDENGIKKFQENSNKLIMWDIPRKQKNFIKDEIEKASNQLTGIYLLVNKENENENEKNEIYIGESDNVATRVLNHISNNKKNFNRIIMIYSDSNSYKLNKDQIRYLEKELISHFKSFPTKWKNQENKEEGKNINIPFFEKEELNNHFKFIMYGFKLFDYDISHSYEEDNIDTSIIKDEIENKEVGEIDVWVKTSINKQTINAKYIPKGDKGLILLKKGIKFQTKLKNYKKGNVIGYIRALKKYKAEGKIDWDKNLDPLKDIIFIEILNDSLFTPSGIACLILGRVFNGYTYWKDKNGNYINKYRNYDFKFIDYNSFDSHEEENINTEIIENEKSNEINVSIKTYVGNKKINAKYIPEGNKGNILLKKGIKFKTKLKIKKERNLTLFVKALNKYKKERKIDWDETLNPFEDIISITIINKSLFTPSGIASLILGITVNGYDFWKDKDGNDLNKYRK